MTKKEIERELERVYKEMKSWSEINKRLNGVVPKEEILRRELILLLQQILYRIEDAKKEGNKNKEYFNSDLFKVIRPRTICREKNH
ncbi:MAG: hypothetical protein QMD05_07170 [Candidatus Brocadiaceae bacterium]|nr:hypothetical protein [Candidatus Brocadiaceae bacterium]